MGLGPPPAPAVPRPVASEAAACSCQVVMVGCPIERRPSLVAEISKPMQILFVAPFQRGRSEAASERSKRESRTRAREARLLRSAHPSDSRVLLCQLHCMRLYSITM